MEFLSIAEIRARETEVRHALDDLLRLRSVAPKPKALQWRFLRACAERLFTADPSDFDNITAGHAAQLKIEVRERLRRHSPARLGLVVDLVHRRELIRRGFPDAKTYPALAGYCVVVRDTSCPNGATPTTRGYLERVVVEACNAEFRAYAAIPEITLDGLQRWFDPEGPAYQAVVQRLARVKAADYTLNNPLNPSCHQVRSVRVRRMGTDEAVVASVEYWRLMWWHPPSRDYPHIFDDATRQTYELRRHGDVWCVFANHQPAIHARRRGSTTVRATREHRTSA